LEGNNEYYKYYERFNFHNKNWLTSRTGKYITI
jgi:hypothetical protein